MFLGRVVTYRDLFVYILVLYVRLHSDFGVQSQYNREQLLLPSYYYCYHKYTVRNNLAR